MYDKCFRPCMNKTYNGFCKTTTCINPLYCNIGTAQYGQGVQKRIITNADRIRAMTDEELAHLLHSAEEHLFTGNLWNYDKWTEWLKQEAT